MARTVPSSSDPARRLLAAVVVCAVRDVLAPAANVSMDDRMSAHLFLQQNVDLVANLAGVNANQVQAILDSVPPMPVQLPLFLEA